MTRLAIWMYFKKNQNGIDAIGNDVLKKNETIGNVLKKNKKSSQKHRQSHVPVIFFNTTSNTSR